MTTVNPAHLCDYMKKKTGLPLDATAKKQIFVLKNGQKLEAKITVTSLHPQGTGAFSNRHSMWFSVEQGFTENDLDPRNDNTAKSAQDYFGINSFYTGKVIICFAHSRSDSWTPYKRVPVDGIYERIAKLARNPNLKEITL